MLRKNYIHITIFDKNKTIEYIAYLYDVKKIYIKKTNKTMQ